MTSFARTFLPALPPLDYAAESARIESFMARAVGRLKRRGVVLGVSGGVDSAVCAALAARALGSERVFALLMPERESDDDSVGRAVRLCRRFNIAHAVEDVTGGLEAIGCYRRRDDAVRRLCPEYGAGWRHKIAIASSAESGIPFFNLVVESPNGARAVKRMPADVYLQVVAATNYKQRLRKAVEYFHAERLNHAVVGTPNRLEYDLGFFVRGGDGLADLKPIAHLYKTQVYALAEHLGIPEEIRSQPPSTNTYSLPQTQEEFFFALPYDKADLMLHAMTAGIPEETMAAALGVEPARVRQVWRDFAGKRRLAERTLGEALLVGEG